MRQPVDCVVLTAARSSEEEVGGLRAAARQGSCSKNVEARGTDTSAVDGRRCCSR